MPFGASSTRDDAARVRCASRRARRRALRADVQRLRRVVGEHLVVLGQPPRRIEDDAQRVRAGHVARRQLRIVGRDRAGADDHGVAQRAHAVQVQDVLLAGDELRVAGVGGDEAVEALAEMADGDRPCRRGAGDRQVEIDERLSRVGRTAACIPACACAPRDDRLRVLVADRDENALLQSSRTCASRRRCRAASAARDVASTIVQAASMAASWSGRASDGGPASRQSIIDLSPDASPGASHVLRSARAVEPSRSSIRLRRRHLHDDGSSRACRSARGGRATFTRLHDVLHGAAAADSQARACSMPVAASAGRCWRWPMSGMPHARV